MNFFYTCGFIRQLAPHHGRSVANKFHCKVARASLLTKATWASPPASHIVWQPTTVIIQ